MQANNIKIDGVYAINLDNALARFQVTKIVTTRVRTHATNNVSSVVFGRRPSGSVLTTYHDGFEWGPMEGPYAVEALLGDYQEHAELVAQREAEKAAAEKLRAEAEEEQNRILAVLKRVLPPQSVAVGRFGGGVIIDMEGSRELAELIQNGLVDHV